MVQWHLTPYNLALKDSFTKIEREIYYKYLLYKTSHEMQTILPQVLKLKTSHSRSHTLK